MEIKHNCCKDCNFEWKAIAGNGGDIVTCKDCGRTFIEEVKK